MSIYGSRTTTNHLLVAMGYSRGVKMNWLWNIGHIFTSDKKTMELWRSDYPLWYKSFKRIVIPWLTIWQEKDLRLSPQISAILMPDHVTLPFRTECLTALGNKMHSRHLAEISWKGELRVAHAPVLPGIFSAVPLLAIPTCMTVRAWRTCREACRDS